MGYYYGVLIPCEEGYVVFFPDVPEAGSQGKDIAECLDMGADSLKTALEEYAKSRKPLPEPCDLHTARARIAAQLQELEIVPAGECLYQLFAAPSVDLVPVKISISVPKSVLAEIDDKAAHHGMTRSGFLVAAARAYV